MSRKKFDEYVCFITASLKTKRKLLISAIVISLGIFLLNIILEASIEVAISMSSVVMYGIVTVSTFQDFNFLHRREEVAYYLGKPTTLWSLIKKYLITNLVLWFGVYITLLLLSLLFVDSYSLSYFLDGLLTFGHWELLFIFAITLASVLATTPLSTLLTSFVFFGLPFIIVQMFSSHVNFVTQFTQGFVGLRHRFDIVERFTQTIYTVNVTNSSLSYFINKGIYLAILLLVTMIAIKYSSKWRRNENESNGFVFGQIQLILTIIVSSFFAVIIAGQYSYNINKIISAYMVYAIVFYLVYMTATMILDMRFKITSKMVRYSSISILSIVAFLAILNTIFNVAATKLPNLDKVSSVEISTYSSYGQSIETKVILTEREDIEKTIALHESILNSSYNNLNMQGSIIEFHYNIVNGFDFNRSFGGNSYGSFLEDDKEIAKAFKVFREDQSIQESIALEILTAPVGFKLVDISYTNIKEEKNKSDLDYQKIYPVLMQELKVYINDKATIRDIAKRPTYYSNYGKLNVYVEYFTDQMIYDEEVDVRLDLAFVSSDGDEILKTIRLNGLYFKKTIEIINQ